VVFSLSKCRLKLDCFQKMNYKSFLWCKIWSELESKVLFAQHHCFQQTPLVNLIINSKKLISKSFQGGALLLAFVVNVNFISR